MPTEIKPCRKFGYQIIAERHETSHSWSAEVKVFINSVEKTYWGDELYDCDGNPDGNEDVTGFWEKYFPDNEETVILASGEVNTEKEAEEKVDELFEKNQYIEQFRFR